MQAHADEIHERLQQLDAAMTAAWVAGLTVHVRVKNDRSGRRWDPYPVIGIHLSDYIAPET